LYPTLPQALSSLKNDLLKVFTLPELFVAITINLWTSSVIESYIMITDHFINNEWKIESKVLQTKEIQERQAGENIAKALRSAIKKWKIDESSTSAIVYDIASNMNHRGT